MEVARAPAAEDTFRGHLPVKDLSSLLGGDPETRPGTLVVLDSSPTIAARTRQVEGVFDASAHLALPLPSRLVPLLAPAIKQGLVSETGLTFELDGAHVTRGLPRPQRRLELLTAAPHGPALVFETGPLVLALPLVFVSQVTAKTHMFNPAPGTSSFLGVLMHQQRLVPAYSLSSESPEALFLVAELPDGPVALAASKAHGVRHQAALGDAQVIDAIAIFG